MPASAVEHEDDVFVGAGADLGGERRQQRAEQRGVDAIGDEPHNLAGGWPDEAIEEAIEIEPLVAVVARWGGSRAAPRPCAGSASGRGGVRRTPKLRPGRPLRCLEARRPGAFLTLLWRYLLVWPQADRTEDPVLWPGLRPQCFQGPAPAQIVGEISGGDTMEAAHPFLEPSVIGIDVVDVKIGRLRAWLARGRQDVDRDRSLEGEGDDGGTAIAAELVGRRDDTTEGGRDGRPVQLGQHRIDRGAAAVSRDDDRNLFGGEAPLGRLTASLARSTGNAGPLALEGFQNKRLIALDNSRQVLRLVQAQGFKKPVPPPECRRVSDVTSFRGLRNAGPVDQGAGLFKPLNLSSANGPTAFSSER